MGPLRTSVDVERMVETLRRVAPRMVVGIAIREGQSWVDLPAPDPASFSYLVLRKGLWTLFEGSTDRSSWACSPPTTVVVGTAADAPEDVARNALAWHAKPRAAKVALDD